MQLKFFLIYILLSVFVASCGKTDHQKKLEAREKLVYQEEQRLNALEQQLRLREIVIFRREMQLDSLKNKNDTIGIKNLQLVGNWQVSMQCTEATCEGYAVGDTKTEQWNISYQNDKVIVTAMSNKKVIRIYWGLFNGTSLNLKAMPPPDAESQINVVLNPDVLDKNLMDGRRVIEKGGNCRVVFVLKLEKL
ncbi:MAG: hypothetical protein ACYCZO_13915 [Daejeonella sp.]